MEKLKTKTE